LYTYTRGKIMMKNIRAETGTGLPGARKDGVESSEVVLITRQMIGKYRLHGAEDLPTIANEDNGRNGRKAHRDMHALNRERRREQRYPLSRRIFPWV
jgi:hypothetical protein